MQLKPTIQYKAGFKYQLAEDYMIPNTGLMLPGNVPVETTYITIWPTGSLLIKKHYAWDGPSGPTIDTKTFMRGSLVHDAIYQLIRMEILPMNPSREVADDLLYSICIEDGMWPVRAWWVYKALRWGGGPAADPSAKKKIITAPDYL